MIAPPGVPMKGVHEKKVSKKMLAAAKEEEDDDDEVEFDEDMVAAENSALVGVQFRDDGEDWKVFRVEFDAEHETCIVYYYAADTVDPDIEDCEYSSLEEVKRWIARGKAKKADDLVDDEEDEEVMPKKKKKKIVKPPQKVSKPPQEVSKFPPPQKVSKPPPQKVSKPPAAPPQKVSKPLPPLASPSDLLRAERERHQAAGPPPAPAESEEERKARLSKQLLAKLAQR